MNREYTFTLEETVSRQWTFSCHAASAESAFDMAKTHLLSPVTQWARQVSDTTAIDRVIKARVNGTHFDIPPAPAAAGE
jgi:hypothetical protein